MQRVLSLLLSVIYTIITMHYHHNDHSVIVPITIQLMLLSLLLLLLLLCSLFLILLLSLCLNKCTMRHLPPPPPSRQQRGLLLLSTARRYCLIPTAAATVDKAALPGCCRRYVLYLGFIFWSVSGLFCRLFRISLYSYSFYFFVSSQKTHKYHTK